MTSTREISFLGYFTKEKCDKVHKNLYEMNLYLYEIIKEL